MAETPEIDSLRTYAIGEVVIASDPKTTGALSEQPFSYSELKADDIEQLGIRSVKDAALFVPNLFMPDYGSKLTSAIYIRGIGSRINTPAVGLYVDDVPYNDKSAFDFNLCDIVRMDVLRGPQGTLYGRNTMGGLIKVYTRSPLNYEGTNLTIGYGSGDHHRRASLTHYHRPSNEFAFSAGGYYEGSEGFFQNTYTKKKVDAIIKTSTFFLFLFSHTELASAILLIVEIVLLDDGDAAFTQTALAPILLPPNDIGIMRNGIMSGFVDLFQTLPSAGSKSGSNNGESMFVSVTGGIQ